MLRELWPGLEAGQDWPFEGEERTETCSLLETRPKRCHNHRIWAMTSSSQKFPRLATDAATGLRGGASERRSGSQEASSYLAGEVIGDRYRLVRELGRGGMGVVWVAHSLVLGVDVALKLIRAAVAGPTLASRMAREAHAAARLGHPALVRVFDFGWTNRGDPFLVMELVQGETLSALLAREGRLAAIRSVQMLLPIADGLRLAHDKSIVHRDIKPDNIFLASDALGRTQPKLLDFGIAKVDATNHDSTLTQVGAVLGSPEYMSPEQALGVDDVDERTDVWSLSVVLYEMITGTVPLRRSNYNALMQAIIHEEPSPTSEYAAGDAGLWHVIKRGLAKERAQRWADMTELGEALALWLYEHGIKEDLSGNSIRAVWLDAGLGGARLELPDSSPPDRRIDSDTPSRSSSLTDRSARGAPGESRAPGTPARRRQTRTIALALAFGAGVGGVVAALALSSRSTPTLPPAPEPPRPSVAAALTRPVTSAAIPVAAFAVASTAPAAGVATSKPEPRKYHLLATKPVVTRAPPTPPKAAKTAKRTHDFGF
jgi:serine/threonine protein kinase